MDRTGFIILIACFLLLLGWGPFVDKYLTPQNPQQDSPAQTPDSPSPGTAAGPSGEAPDPAPGPENLAAPVERDLPESFEAEERSLENSHAIYRLDNLDGGIQSIELRDYPVPAVARTGEEQASGALINRTSLRSVMSLRLGGRWIEGWRMTSDGGSVQMERELEGGLRATKIFTPQEDYVVRVRTRIENVSGQALRLPEREWLVGTAAPMEPEDDQMLIGFSYGAASDVEQIRQSWFENRTLGCFPGTPRFLYQEGASPVAWASVDSQFFTVALVPEASSPADSIQSQWTDLALEGEERVKWKVSRGFETTLRWNPRVLEPDEALEEEFRIYGGPKKYSVLSRLGKELGNDIEEVMGFGGFFGFFAKALLLSMNGLHSLGLGYGLSIVAITFIIKLLFWPLTQASTRSMKRMSALQPQMKEIQEKYKDNPQKMNKKLMEFMRRNKVSPLGGCLPILLQLPVFFGFYTMLQSAIELRGASFLWTADLSKPDTIFVVPGLEIPFNLWPLLMGAAQIWQMRMTPVSPGMDPTQQKILRYMPIIFVFILYNFSAALALYWTVQNILSIVQMKLIRHDPIPVAAAAAGKAAPRKIAPPSESRKPARKNRK